MRVDHAEIINNYLRELDQNEHIAWTDYREGFVVISIKASKGITAQDFEKILKDFSEFCQKNQYEQYCRHCGETKELIVGSVYGNNNLYCDDCLKSFEESQSKAKKANVPLGIIGALLGSIIGVVAFFAISFRSCSANDSYFSLIILYAPFFRSVLIRLWCLFRIVRELSSFLKCSRTSRSQKCPLFL